MVNCGAPTFDCSSHANDIHATPTSVSCAADPCTDAECCTVTPTSGSNAGAGGSNAGATITQLANDLSSLTTKVTGLETKVTGLETTLTEVEGDVVTLRREADEADEGGFSWNPLTWFEDEGVVTETFSNKDNNLFFVLAMIIIIYYCLKR
jgi:hypothetical protein